MQSRVSILEQVLHLSEKQLNIVRLGDVSLLLQLLARKQKVFEAFEKLERDLDPFRNIAPRDRTWESEQERLDCDTAVRKCKELLAAILELDGQSEAELARQKDETERQIRKMDTSGKAASAYARQNIIPVSPKMLSATRLDFKE